MRPGAHQINDTNNKLGISILAEYVCERGKRAKIEEMPGKVIS